MKNLCACLLAALPAWAAAENPVFDELTTLEGRTYRDVRVLSEDAARIRIEHETGLASIPLDRLPTEFREYFGYDPDAARQLLEREAEVEAIRKNFQRRFARWLATERHLATRHRNELGRDGGRALHEFSCRFQTIQHWANQLEAEGWNDRRIQMVVDAAFERKPQVGMSARLLDSTMGKPAAIESSLTDFGVVDVWIYPAGKNRRQECQFEDGILVSIRFEETLNLVSGGVSPTSED